MIWTLQTLLCRLYRLNARVPSTESRVDFFSGEFIPPKPAFFYRAALAVSAFAMVLLPAIYLALIGLVAWGVYFHLVHNAWLGSGGGGFWLYGAIAYAAPAVAGGILIFFMLKPFVGRKQSTIEPIALDPATEPMLFAFVAKICALVRAPPPSQINVDCQVNASAGLRRGFWSRDLVLTIGLPLVAGLDMRQFAGVLAHEFGHFAQGAGMRLSYTIRKVNHWFYRVVYERDQWDKKLDETANTADFRFGVMLHCARGSIWLSRRILWLLMHAGHAVSCFMLRQMEYDADACEAKLVGSATFESTSQKLAVLNVANQLTLEDLSRNWKDGRLVDNLPTLVRHKRDSLSKEFRCGIEAAAITEKTGYFDTHPCDSDRIRAVRRLNEPGIFQLIEPATSLFSDFGSLARGATRFHYENDLGLGVNDENLIGVDEILRETFAQEQREELIRKFYGSVAPYLFAALVGPIDQTQKGRHTVITEWRQQRQVGEALRGEAEVLSEEIFKDQVRLLHLTAVSYLTKANVFVDPKEFGLSKNATTIATQSAEANALAELVAESISSKLQKLDRFARALQRRVTLPSTLEISEPQPTDPAKSRQIGSLSALLAALGAELPLLRGLSTKLHGVKSIAKNRPGHPSPAYVDEVATPLASEIADQIQQIVQRLRDFPYPFTDLSGGRTVADHLTTPLSAVSQDWLCSCLQNEVSLDRLFTLYRRLLAEFLSYVDAAEMRLDSQENQLERAE